MQIPERLAELEATEVIRIARHRRRICFDDPEAPEIELERIGERRECASSGELPGLLEQACGSRTGLLRWWAIDRVEDCSLCGRRFRTSQSHWALAVTIERLGEPEASLVACWYPERYCTRCQPVGEHDGASGMLVPVPTRH